MNTQFRYADLHCHPNLKTFGHSFDRKAGPKSDLWHTVRPSFGRRLIQRLTGITKYSQSDLSTLSIANARIALVSLYPFEKGFFINRKVWPPLAAFLADWGIEIGYRRIRFIQEHTDYFDDLVNEYRFVCNGRKEAIVGGRRFRYVMTRNWAEVEQVLGEENSIAVVLTIEGAHVFNAGLGEYGRMLNEEEILANIQTVKNWDYPPLFTGLAHNFNNDLCGHARSLQRLGKLVNQERNIDIGLTPAGIRVTRALLCNDPGRRILIDLKHMSLAARLDFYRLLQTDFPGERIPFVVSHGSVTGTSIDGSRWPTGCADIFNTNDLNFFDEEIIRLAGAGGLFAIQMDFCVHADPQKVKRYFREHPAPTPISRSAMIIWNQLQHIAAVCDANGLFAWGCTAVGSDFDGSIHPFPGVPTAAGLESLARELQVLAARYLALGTLSLPQNREISAAEVVERFMYENTRRFLEQHYR